MENPKWVIWLWTNFGKNLQKEYDNIKSWGLDDKTKALLDLVWGVLTPSIQATLWVFIKAIYDKYGPDVAKKILVDNLTNLQEK